MSRALSGFRLKTSSGGGLLLVAGGVRGLCGSFTLRKCAEKETIVGSKL
jgi:hypothetical protein